MKHSNSWKASIAVGALALLAGAFGACTSKSSPTAPPLSGGGTPPTGSGSTLYNITVTASPSSLAVLVPLPTSTITVNVRNASTGAPPPDGTTAVVTTNLGTLSGTTGSGQRVDVSLVNGQAVLTYTPPAALEVASTTAIVQAQLEQSVGQATITLTGEGTAAPFVLDHAQPNSGDPSGGQRVTLHGQGFEAPITVLFGGTSAQVNSVSSNRAVVTTPPLLTPLAPGETQAVTITVNNAIGSTHPSSASLVNGFIYAHGGSVASPVIFTITPTTGPQEGGTPIVITGSNFHQDSQVIFRLAGGGGSIDLEAPTNFAGANRLESLTPDIRAYIAAGTLNAPFNAQVRVVNPNGATAIFSNQFTYGSTIRITSVGPGSGPFTGGTRVTITGSGFVEPVAVSLGGIGQQVLSVSGTQITFQTVGLSGSAVPPCNGQTSAPLTVTNIVGGASASGGSFTFTGPPNPVVFGIAPNHGIVTAAVVVSGQNFDPAALRVLFGGADGAAAPISGASSTTINVTVPTPPPSFQFNTVACDANGDNIASGTRNIPTSISVTVRNVTTGCESTLSNAFTMDPTDLTCTGDTSQPPVTTVACNDGADNAGDGFIDFGGDTGCTSATGTTELTQCQDGIDNDSDTFTDAADPQCSGVQDTSET